jgi:hypothetical protein
VLADVKKEFLGQVFRFGAMIAAVLNELVHRRPVAPAQLLQRPPRFFITA